MLKTENRAAHFAELPQTRLLSKLKRYFSSMELFSKNSEDSCSIIIKNNTMHMAKFPNATKGHKKPYHHRETISL